MARAEDVVKLVRGNPGLSDREITDRLFGKNVTPQPINGVCRLLAAKKLIDRCLRPDGSVGNFPVGEARPTPSTQIVEPRDLEILQASED
jgi:hypothetical protein